MAAERHRDALAQSEPAVEQEAPEEAPVEAAVEAAVDDGAEQAPSGEAPVEGGAEQTPPAPHCDHEDAEQQLMKDLEELAAKAERADEYLLLAQRTQADFENYRKRAAREAALAQERGIAKLAKELLPAIDNLDRALKAASEEQSPLAEGIKLVHTDLLSALQRVGVEAFSPEGEPFDPQLHEAVAQAPIDGAESGTVAEVFQQGYRLGDTVLRPARVLVAA
jgi:molecular chaperone GrpE